MSESSLSIGVVELRVEIGFYLGYGRTPGSWSASQLSEINGVVQSGIRRVYYPPAIDAQSVGYEWSWLRPTKTLDIVASDGDYDLPDDYGRMVGVFNYAAAEYRRPISVISVGKLLTMRDYADLSDFPIYAAIRYKASTGVTGQRQEVLFYPKPSVSKTLSYEYEAYSGALTDAFPYPLGGMQLAELYIESCLALAESRINDEIGQHTQQYRALLLDAIARDRKHGARIFGQMGHVERTYDERDFRRGLTGSVYPITYKGEDL